MAPLPITSRKMSYISGDDDTLYCAAAGAGPSHYVDRRADG